MKPANKNSQIHGLQSAVMGVDVPGSIAADRCVRCKKLAAEFKDELSRREFAISGLCQPCQDEIFGGQDG